MGRFGIFVSASEYSIGTAAFGGRFTVKQCFGVYLPQKVAWLGNLPHHTCKESSLLCVFVQGGFSRMHKRTVRTVDETKAKSALTVEGQNHIVLT